MGKKQWGNQADAYVSQVLDLLKEYEDVDYIGQESYKSDFFAIFSDAYRSGFCSPGYRIDNESNKLVLCKSQRPLVSGDTIWSYAIEHGWVDAEMHPTEKKYRDIHMVKTWWDEWVYAWNRNPPQGGKPDARPAGFS